MYSLFHPFADQIGGFYFIITNIPYWICELADPEVHFISVFLKKPTGNLMKNGRIKKLLTLIWVLLLSAIGFGMALKHVLKMEVDASSTNSKIEVTLNEGTNMASALSPDQKTLAIDLLGQLWLLPVEGGIAKSLTDPLGDARQPAWSPDGRFLAFQAYWDGNWHIYTIHRDGTNLQQRTSGPFDHREPHWSPDGRHIAFSSDRDGTYDIWALDTANSQLKQQTEAPANEYAPAWSPDGAQIGFVSDDPSNLGIHILSIKDGNIRLIYTSKDKLAGVAWSPDGQSIFFNQLDFTESKLMRVDVANDEPQPERISQPDEDVFPFRPSFLSETKLIYTASGKIWRKDVAEDTAKEIPFAVTVQLNKRPYARRQRDFDSTESQPVRGIVGPVISPDGGQVAFVALGDLWLQGEGQPAQPLTDDPYVELSPAWSPNGAALAYISDRGGQFAIWIHDFLKKENRKLGVLQGSPAGIAWSPDGRSIAYSVSFGPRLGQVMLIDTSTGQSRKVGPRLSSSISSPTWSPDGKTIGVGVLQPYSTLYREGINRIVYMAVNDKKTWGLRGLEHWSLGVRGKDGPVWSPDGRHLALISQGLLWIAPVDHEGQITGPPIRLTNELADMPSWTADGRNLLYMATDQLKRINLDNGQINAFPIQLEWSRHLPAGRTVIHAGGLFDGIHPEIRRNVDIILEANRIVAIEAHRPDRQADRKVDASDQYVMPGLIDYHAHQGSWDGEKLNRKWLAWGVTATRDPATDPYDARNRLEAQESGRTIGPRIFFTGSPIDGNRIYYGGTYAQQAPAQLELELQRAEALNYDMIKTYVRLPDPLQKRVVEKAHQLGIPVSSHELYPAVAYGVDGVEHIQGTSRRGYSPKITGILRSYGDVSQLIAISGMTFTPTVGIYVSYKYLLVKEEELLNDRRLLALEDPQRIKQVIDEVRTNPDAWAERFQNAMKMVRDIHEQGGTVVAGTDGPIIPFGFGLYMELLAYAEGGLSIFDVLQTATINAAQALGAEADLGSVEPGKLADLIILNQNPLADIRHLRSLHSVVLNGEIHTLEALLRAPARKRQ